MDAKKCDRCGSYFDYDPSAKNNFIAFGHKDIVVGRNFPTKDICPNCMESFMEWFERPVTLNSEDCLVDAGNDDKNNDPCSSCINPYCEQRMYSYKSLEERIRIAKERCPGYLEEEKNND